MNFNTCLDLRIVSVTQSNNFSPTFVGLVQIQRKLLAFMTLSHYSFFNSNMKKKNLNHCTFRESVLIETDDLFLLDMELHFLFRLPGAGVVLPTCKLFHKKLSNMLSIILLLLATIYRSN